MKPFVYVKPLSGVECYRTLTTSGNPLTHLLHRRTSDCRLYFTLEWTREVITTLYHGRHSVETGGTSKTFE